MGDRLDELREGCFARWVDTFSKRYCCERADMDVIKMVYEAGYKQGSLDGYELASQEYMDTIMKLSALLSELQGPIFLTYDPKDMTAKERDELISDMQESGCGVVLLDENHPIELNIATQRNLTHKTKGVGKGGK